MFEHFESHPAVNVLQAEYQRLLGFPRGHVIEGRAGELAAATSEWFAKHGNPWIYARQADTLTFAADRLGISGREFSSKQLHDQFAIARASHAIVVAVSAGPECEQKARELWQEGKPDEYFFMEAFGSAVVEHLIASASGRICSWADSNGMVALPHYSPGYSGWDVSDQNELWSLIQLQNSQAIPAGLQVMESGMLRPKKSLLAVFGITANLEQARRLAKLVPCENCSLPECQYRRGPYRHSQPQIADVSRLQGGLENEPADPNGPTQNPAPKYSVNARALRKWSQERLWLHTAADGVIEARFRYEGTTCSNLGRPLAYDFHIRLQPPEQHYRIVAANYTPAPDDIGHASQCAYLQEGDQLQRGVETELPLLGKPLGDVFTWERSPNPAGCFCEPTARAHKWGLVFEVIHYALTQQIQAHNAPPSSAQPTNNLS